MDDSVKWLLLGGAAYLIYTQYVAPSPVASNTGNAPASIPASPEALTLYTLEQTGPGPILTAAITATPANGGVPASGPQLLNAWQWSYFTEQMTGVHVPDMTQYLGDMSQEFPLSSFWAALMQWAQAQVVAASQPSAAGVSGLGLAGLAGHELMRNVKRQHQPPQHIQLTQSKYFAEPGDNVNGRYDMADMGWA